MWDVGKGARFVAKYLHAASELMVPAPCPGCGAYLGIGDDSDSLVCAECKEELSHPPVRFSSRVATSVPMWTCGPYSGARRAIVIAAKEHNEVAARHAMGAVFSSALGRLVADGILPHPSITPIVLIPAPTKDSSARRRGGDPVTAACNYVSADHAGVVVKQLLRTVSSATDSSELGASRRRTNISGAVQPAVDASSDNYAELVKQLAKCCVVVVDDVVTTGSTMSEATLVLASMGLKPDAALTFTRA